MTSADWTKPVEGVEAQTYGRKNDLERELLWQQMAEFEKTRKVTICPIGASSSHKPITKPNNLDNAQAGRNEYNDQKKPRPPRNKGEGDFEFDPTENRSTVKSSAGHQNLITSPCGNSVMVNVGRNHLGTFKTIEEALSVRDSYRAKVGLPRAQY